MGWTQDDVIQELACQGIEVNERRLTDWRQKGLLPDLEKVRNAHGRISYVWNQSNIVAHVKMVAELFAHYGRTSRFAHILWLLGYEVRPELVMENIRAPFVSVWRLWSGGARVKDDILDNISRLATRMTWRRESRPSDYPDHEQAAEFVERAMSYVTDPTYPAHKLIDELATQTSSSKAREDNGSVQSSAIKVRLKNGDSSYAMIVPAVKFLQRHLTLSRIANAASKATWEDFSEAGIDFGVLRDIVTVFVLHDRTTTRIRDRNPALWTALRNGSLSKLGPLIIIGDIALRRAGYGRRIRAYLRLFRRKVGTSEVLIRALAGQNDWDVHFGETM